MTAIAPTMGSFLDDASAPSRGKDHPMTKHPRAVLSIATAALVLLLPACGGSTAVTGATVPDNESALAPEETTESEEMQGSSTLAPSPTNAVPLQGSEPVPSVEGTLDQSQISQNIVSTDPATTDPFLDYTSYVGRNLIDSWAPWFEGRGIPSPDVGFLIVPPGSEQRTACGGEGAGTLVDDTGSAFYCHIDQLQDGTVGAIWLPLTSMIGVWNGDVYGRGFSEWPGDFAYAETLGHEFGHHVTSSLIDFYQQTQPELQVMHPLGAWNELLADCFAGNWTQAAFNQGILENGDYLEAVSKIGLTGDDIVAYGPEGQVIFNPGTDPHGAPNHRQGAFRVGIEGLPDQGIPPGDPQACINTYWITTEEYRHDMMLPVL